MGNKIHIIKTCSFQPFPVKSKVGGSFGAILVSLVRLWVSCCGRFIQSKNILSSHGTKTLSYVMNISTLAAILFSVYLKVTFIVFSLSYHTTKKKTLD